MTSFIHYCDQPYLIMGEEQIDARTKRLKVSRYYGKDAPAQDGNAAFGLEIIAQDDMYNPTSITLREVGGAVTGRTPAPSVEIEAYVPPEGEATMKVYCLQNKAGKRFWYVNASKTKQYREEQFMDDAKFIVFDVPKTKSGLIHFLNEVCS